MEPVLERVGRPIVRAAVWYYRTNERAFLWLRSKVPARVERALTVTDVWDLVVPAYTYLALVLLLVWIFK